LITYPGLPAPEIAAYLDRAESRSRYDDAEFHIARIHMVANTGTYIDAPFHRFPDGIDIAALPLERIAFVEAVVIDVTGRRAITPHEIADLAVESKAVLFHTGWSRHWETPAYAVDHPFVDESLAVELVRRRVALVGIDALNIDDTSQRRRPVHTALLEAGIPIVEHLCNLDQLPASGFRFTAVPAPFVGIGSFPVRAFATLRG
jgi:kynurenine formamidase